MASTSRCRSILDVPIQPHEASQRLIPRLRQLFDAWPEYDWGWVWNHAHPVVRITCATRPPVPTIHIEHGICLPAYSNAHIEEEAEGAVTYLLGEMIFRRNAAATAQAQGIVSVESVGELTIMGSKMKLVGPPGATWIVPEGTSYEDIQAYAGLKIATALSSLHAETSTPGPIALVEQLCPAMTEHTAACPQEGCTRPPDTLPGLVMHLNDSHAWAREEIADWLDSLDVDLTIPPASQGD